MALNLAYLDVCPGAHVHVEGCGIHHVARVADTLVGHDSEDGINPLPHFRVGVAVQLGKLQAYGVHIQQPCQRRRSSRITIF